MQGLILWVPVEKLFMSEIGFTPASVGVMAAAYAAVVPLLEVPSGILADRWSRNRLMVLACVALLASSAIGGLSQNVGDLRRLGDGPRRLLRPELRDRRQHRLRHRPGGDRVERAVRDVDRPGPDGRERGARGQCPRRRAARRADLRPAHLLRHAPVRAPLRSSPSCGSTSPACTGPPSPPRCAATSPLTLRTMTRRRDVLPGAAALGAGRDAVRRPCSSSGRSGWSPWRAGAAVRPVLGAAHGDARRSAATSRRSWTCRGAASSARWPSSLAATLVPRADPVLAAVVAAQTVLALVLSVVGCPPGSCCTTPCPRRSGPECRPGPAPRSWVLFLPFSLALGWLGRRAGRPRPDGCSRAPPWSWGRSCWCRCGSPGRAKVAPASDDLACQELVDLVTDYLDDVLPPGWRDGVDPTWRTATGAPSTSARSAPRSTPSAASGSRPTSTRRTEGE